MLSPDNEVVPDLAQRLPGRGAWVSADREHVKRAADKALFARVFRAKARVRDDLDELVARLLRERALGYLSMADKAGALVLGFEKIRRRIAEGDVQVLVSAADAGDDGARKLRKGHNAGVGDKLPVSYVTCFERSELNLALGRPNVVHAAVIRHGLADQFSDAAGKYAGYRGIALSSDSCQAA